MKILDVIENGMIIVLIRRFVVVKLDNKMFGSFCSFFFCFMVMIIKVFKRMVESEVINVMMFMIK